MKSTSQFLRRREGQEDEADNVFKNDALEKNNRKNSMKTKSLWVLGLLTIYVAMQVSLTSIFHKSADKIPGKPWQNGKVFN